MKDDSFWAQIIQFDSNILHTSERVLMLVGFGMNENCEWQSPEDYDDFKSSYTTCW